MEEHTQLDLELGVLLHEGILVRKLSTLSKIKLGVVLLLYLKAASSTPYIYIRVLV
jgi:hypothetical protein